MVLLRPDTHYRRIVTVEELRLIVIERDRNVRMLVRAALHGSPYEIVDEADTQEKAVVSIARARELGANVIVLGNSPEHGQPTGPLTESVLGILEDAQAVDPGFRPAIFLISGWLSHN